MSRRRREQERSVRGDSPTNQLRLWNKQRLGKRSPPALEPISPRPGQGNKSVEKEDAAVTKPIQGTFTIQRLVDDFVSAASAGDGAKVAQFLRTDIPVDRLHNLLRYNALHASAALRSGDIARQLLEAGADVDALTQDHETALHLAARYGSQAVAKELLLHSADKRIANNKGMIPMEVAADVQNHKLERLLEPPPVAPIAVSAIEASPTALVMTWSTIGTLPSPCLYKIAWMQDGVDDDTKWTERECSEPIYRITDLLPSSGYHVIVKAGNHLIGWSPSSSPAVFRTANDVPNPVMAPKVTEVGSTFMKLEVKLPRENGTPISRVALQWLCQGGAFQTIDTGTVSTTSARGQPPAPADRAESWDTRIWNLDRPLTSDRAEGADAGSRTSRIPVRKEGKTIELMASGLVPGQVYVFRAKACNANGWSIDGDVSNEVFTEECPQIVATTARTMTLVWTRAIICGQSADAYRVDMRLDKSEQWKTAVSSIDGETCIVQGLVPFCSYRFRVVPHFQASGWVDAARCASSALVTTHAAPPEPPVNFHVVERAAQSITVSWGLPRCNGHGIASYRLEVFQQIHHKEGSESRSTAGNNDQWRVVDNAIPVSTKMFALTGLPSGRAYLIRVSARNALGLGEYAELPQSIWTHCLCSPCAPQCIGKTSCSLEITWEDDDESGASIDGNHASIAESEKRYELQMHQTESRTGFFRVFDYRLARSAGWTTVAKDLLERLAVVPDLLPLRHYCFRVRVYLVNNSRTLDMSEVSEDGFVATSAATSAFSEPSMPIQTLRRY